MNEMRDAKGIDKKWEKTRTRDDDKRKMEAMESEKR